MFEKRTIGIQMFGQMTFGIQMFVVMTFAIQMFRQSNSNVWKDDIPNSNDCRYDIQNSNVWSDDIRKSNDCSEAIWDSNILKTFGIQMFGMMTVGIEMIVVMTEFKCLE